MMQGGGDGRQHAGPQSGVEEGVFCLKPPAGTGTFHPPARLLHVLLDEHQRRPWSCSGAALDRPLHLFQPSNPALGEGLLVCDPVAGRLTRAGARQAGPSFEESYATPIPETADPGVAYASTPSGLELAILDITHPAFACGRMRRPGRGGAGAGPKARGAGLAGGCSTDGPAHILKRSRIGQGLLAAHGSHLDGLSTYLMKLGAPPWPGPPSRPWTAASPAARWPAAAPARHRPGQAQPAAWRASACRGGRPCTCSTSPAGGQRQPEHAAAVASRPPGPAGPRPITVHLLDLDQAGPSSRPALTAWQARRPAGGLHAALHVQPTIGSGARLEAILATLPATRCC